jgi:hypothetical protein
MALTGTSRGSGTHNTAASSRAVSPSGTIPAGSIAVIVWALDNSGTSGVSRFSSMADSVGNTWSTPLNINKTAGTANDGTTLVMSWSKLTTQLLNTNTITITLTGNVTPKCYAIHQITPAAGNSVEYVTSGSTTGTGNVALTTGTIDNLQMVVCAAANEYGTAQTPTHDTDTTNGSWSTALYAEVGTTGAGQNVASQRKVVTASATQTYNVSYSSSADYAAGWLSFKEVIGGTFTANAIVRKTVSPTFAADAVIASAPTTIPGSFTADAIARKTPSASLTANAAIKKTQTPTGKTADAVIKKEQAGSFTAAAVIAAGEEVVPGSFVTDAVLSSEQTGDFTADAIRLKTRVFETWVEGGWADPGLYSNGITLDAVIVVGAEVVPGSLTADSVLLAGQASSFAAAAVIRKLDVTGSFLADAVVLRAGSGSFTAAAIVKSTPSPTLSANAVIKAGASGSATVDAIRLKTWWFGSAEAGF